MRRVKLWALLLSSPVLGFGLKGTTAACGQSFWRFLRLLLRAFLSQAFSISLVSLIIVALFSPTSLFFSTVSSSGVLRPFFRVCCHAGICFALFRTPARSLLLARFSLIISGGAAARSCFPHTFAHFRSFSWRQRLPRPPYFTRAHAGRLGRLQQALTEAEVQL